MSLFELWAGRITIPALPMQRVSVGRNHAIHSPTVSLRAVAKLYDDERNGYRYFLTDLPEPFDKLYLREKGARRLQLDRGALRLLDDVPDGDLSDQTEFEWDDTSTVAALYDTPEKVRESWKAKFDFGSAKGEGEHPGLRPPQLGALHAISAHFSVGSQFEPATVVLPTGTGKTETMLASLVETRPRGLLVLVPSDALRDQTADKFEKLGLLRELGCVPESTINPKVVRLKAGMQSVQDAQEIVENSNVVIALPNTLEASNSEAVELLCQSFDLLFVDEAHHLGANSWKRVRDHFLENRVVQFTATPFRNDRRHIGGKIVFNYKLSDAQQDGYYKKIRLETVEEFGDDQARDRAIAERAVEILRTDREENQLDHLLMARVQNTKKVDELLALYRELAPDLNPVAIYTGAGRKKANEEAFSALRDSGEDSAKVVICVNMLGEGFDLPQLKVAAVHDNHKSLAVTLQFVGRFTRRGENVGDAAVIVNIADTNAEKRLEELYSEDADWDHLVSRLSETQIDDELNLQEVIESLKSGGDLHEKISLWNLSPSLSTQVYRANCENWSPLKFREAFPKDAQLWHSLSEEKCILVVVGHQEFSVKWGRYEDLTEEAYDLLIAYWDAESAALFVHSSNYDRMKVARVAELITSDEAELLNGPRVFNVLNNVELPLAKSLGSSRVGAISFTSYFGPNVTEGLASIEKSESELNHIACLGYEDGDKVLWGAAQKKAKIWQQKNGSINDWMNWCQRTHAKLMDDSGEETNITKDFLRPKKLENLYEHAPISMQWGEYLQSSFSDHLAIIFGPDEIPLFLCDIELVEGDSGEIRFAVFSEDSRSTYSFKIDPSYPKGYLYTHLDGPQLSFRTSKNTVRDFDEQVYKDPPIVRYADGTFSYNNFHVPFDLGAGEYGVDHIEEWDWTGIELNRESMGKGQDQDTIQFRTFEKVADEFAVVFNDDGAGEAADLVAIKDIGESEIGLTLFHCKGAIGSKVSSDIRNFYTVCGQAQKSISTKHEGLKKLSSNLRRRHSTWAARGSTRILKGDLKTLAYFVEKSRKTNVKFEVVIVQPGLSRASLTPDIAKLLATTELFLKRTTEAEFRVIGSCPPED